MSEGHIWIDEVIIPETYDYVKQQLAAQASASKLILHIASPGGSVYDGYKIYHLLKNSGKPIEPIVEGEAQSMASFLTMLGPAKICNPSRFMIHNPRSGVEGTSDQMIQGANELIKIEDEMAVEYAQVTGLPIDRIKQMMKVETVMTAQQAKDFGFVKEVVNGQFLKAVAIGKPVKKMEKKNFIQKTLKLVAEALGEGAPSAMDLKTKEGKVLNVQSEDGELPGKPATIDGQPANGTYMLEDGRSITCENGVVKSVQQAAAAAPAAPNPPPVPAQTAEQRMATMEAELTKIKAEKEAADAARAEAEKKKAEAEADKLKTVTALGDIRKELDEQLKKDIGDQTPPSKGMTPIVRPSGRGGSNNDKGATIMFLNEHFGWLKEYYPKGYFEKEIEEYASRNAFTGPQAVSILETNFNYTYPGLLTTELFYKPTLMNPAIGDMAIIDQGIKSHKQYNLVNPISKILKPYTGCDRVFNNNRALITNTTVRTKEFQVNESWCKDDFTNYLTGGYNFLAQEWMRTGLDSFDPSGTPIAKVIDTVLSNALRLDVFRRFSFAAGNSSDDDYNQFDGLWDRLIDSSGAANYCVVRASATNGAGAVGFGTGTLAANAALTALESAYANSSILLKDWDNIYAQFSGAVQKPVFWVTRSVWDNYYNTLIANGAVTNVTEQSFENLQKGLTTLMYKGYAVRPVSLWDQFLAESDNPLTGTTRHLILFTTKDNHIFGVEQGSDLNKLEGWYERKDRKFYYEADLKMGYNYLHCELQTIIY